MLFSGVLSNNTRRSILGYCATRKMPFAISMLKQSLANYAGYFPDKSCGWQKCESKTKDVRKMAAVDSIIKTEVACISNNIRHHKAPQSVTEGSTATILI
jgi:hypothetical protein